MDYLPRAAALRRVKRAARNRILRSARARTGATRVYRRRCLGCVVVPVTLFRAVAARTLLTRCRTVNAHCHDLLRTRGYARLR